MWSSRDGGLADHWSSSRVGGQSLQQSHSLVSSLNSSCMLSWLSDVAVKVGRQPGFSRPQILIITSISRSIPRDAPSLMKPNPGRTMEPCRMEEPTSQASH